MKSLCTIFLLVIFLSSCQEETFTVSTVVTPTGSGSIEISPNKPEYENGETVTITAVPSENWIFKNWEGDDRGSTNPLQIKINSNKSFTSVFSKKPLPVNISIVGEGTVTEKIISSPSGREYPHGSIIELTATPKAGWIFSNFVIDGKSIAERITKIEVLKQSTIFARFILEPVFGTYIDSRVEEGAISKRTYKTVKIGNQTWYAENSRFRGIMPSYKIKSFQNNPSNDQKFGVYYGASIYQGNLNKNYTTPCNFLDGWFMPTRDDWKELRNYLGGDVAAQKMLLINDWKALNPPNTGEVTGDNSSGFSALPGIFSENPGGLPGFRTEGTHFWTAFGGAIYSAVGPARLSGYFTGLSSTFMRVDNEVFGGLPFPEEKYASVRCIKK
jgi:uncharacterized protein (TIGR02145 family)